MAFSTAANGAKILRRLSKTGYPATIERRNVACYLGLHNSVLRSTVSCGFSAMTLHNKAGIERWPVDGYVTIARGAKHLLQELHNLVHCHGNCGSSK
jgi:hypothetical protein